MTQHTPWKLCAWLFLVVLVLAPSGLPAQGHGEEEEEPKLLGQITAEQLQEEPFSEWFQTRYDEYEPTSEVVADLRGIDRESVGITVFFGTWCSDSQREVPRLVKTLDGIGFARENLTLVAVDHVDGAEKTSPTGEEKGVEVYRVPTIVVFRDGEEVARFVEHSVLSLERDLLAILSGDPYEASYLSYPTIRRWLAEGLLSDANVNPRGLAGQIRQEVGSEGELASASGVLLSRGQTLEATQLARVNCVLYPESPRAFAWLAEALREQGEGEEARYAAERALQLNTDPAGVADLVELLESIEVPEESGS